MARGGSQPGERRGGRKKGTPNRSSADLRALIDTHAAPATLIAALADLAAHAELEQTRLHAINALLDRRFGRPSQELRHADPEGGPSRLIISWASDPDAD